MVAGIGERMTKEFTALASSQVKIKVVAPPDQNAVLPEKTNSRKKMGKPRRICQQLFLTLIKTDVAFVESSPLMTKSSRLSLIMCGPSVWQQCYGCDHNSTVFEV